MILVNTFPSLVSDPIIMLLNFCGMYRFDPHLGIFLMVDDCQMDERLERFWHLVYYQVSGEPGITGCSR